MCEEKQTNGEKFEKKNLQFNLILVFILLLFNKQ